MLHPHVCEMVKVCIHHAGVSRTSRHPQTKTNVFQCTDALTSHTWHGSLLRYTADFKSESLEPGRTRFDSDDDPGLARIACGIHTTVPRTQTCLAPTDHAYPIGHASVGVGVLPVVTQQCSQSSWLEKHWQRQT